MRAPLFVQGADLSMLLTEPLDPAPSQGRRTRRQANAHRLLQNRHMDRTARLDRQHSVKAQQSRPTFLAPVQRLAPPSRQSGTAKILQAVCCEEMVALGAARICTPEPEASASRAEQKTSEPTPNARPDLRQCAGRFAEERSCEAMCHKGCGNSPQLRRFSSDSSNLWNSGWGGGIPPPGARMRKSLASHHVRRCWPSGVTRICSTLAPRRNP
ncbi:hypothetical protein EDE12_102459 [Methylosinus sp. sav-2]|nr:hypothetical protein EDE12_102459 [Methylosinus sp. sav-2]